MLRKYRKNKYDNNDNNYNNTCNSNNTNNNINKINYKSYITLYYIVMLIFNVKFLSPDELQCVSFLIGITVPI